MDPSSDYHEYCTGDFDPEDIVISGISGRFPECDNVGELKDGIYNKKKLVLFTNERYEKGVFKNPYSSCGVVKNVDKLDADFFCLTRGAANSLEPLTRVLLEVAYECIVDSGYDPSELRGTNIGVYNATTGDDGQKIKLSQLNDVSLHSVRTMNANRTSFALDFTGPSHTIDSACSSSAVALNSAVKDLLHGYVDAAVVSGSQLNFDPEITTSYFLAGIASLEGNSVPFDANSDGMLRTEAVTAIFIQKAKTARRAYATVLSAQYMTSGFVPEGISVPSVSTQLKVCSKVLETSGVRFDEIEYIEAHGTGTHVGDPIELNAMAQIYCKNRETPVYIGSIKSNIGHTEASSGICGIISAIIALETGLMPPNINYKTPNPRCEALIEGRLKVVTEPLPLKSPYVPVNSFGFGGTIIQCLLKQNSIASSNRVPLGLPRLVLYPATTEEAVSYVFEYIKNKEDLKNEFFALMNKLSFTSPVLKPFRGYYLFRDRKDPVSQIKLASPTKREVWFIMTGMGCQWAGMGLQLMKIEVFAESMRKSANVLKPYGLELFELLRAEKNYLQMDRCITAAFVTIASIQIALVDLITHLGIKPDGMIGHSTGELICAYADGCLTAEQTILSTFFRGKAVEEANLQSGAMAAVGLSWAQAQELCPEGIYPSCDNASDSVTISGLKEPLEKFVNKLKDEKIFARVVHTYGYAFHCKCVHPAAETLRNYMLKIIPDSKPRSDRWISSSYPEEEWDTPECKVADANYFAHNLMYSVRFKDALKKIPSDAITIEFGPHFLLQSILKRAIGSEATHIGLMKRNEEDNVKFLFESLGKLYNEGLDPKIELLYPPVKFPVPRGTPTISDLIKWNHSQSFFVPKYLPRAGPFHIDFKTDKVDAYLLDHRIDGRPLFPATGYIWMAWEALSFRLFKKLDEFPVIIQNFKIHRATILNLQASIRLTVTILSGTGYFEIKEGNSLVASGEVFEGKDIVYDEDPPTYKCDNYSAVSGSDLYNELKMAGYEYGPEFQSLHEINLEGTNGLVLWKNKWIPFLDSLLLFFGLLKDSKNFCLPTGALSIKIDPIVFRNFVDGKNFDDTTEPQEKYAQDVVPVTFNPNTNTCRSVGVEIAKLDIDPAPRRGKDDTPTTEEYKFIPYVSTYTPPTKELELHFSNYTGMCNKLINDIQKVIGANLLHMEFPVRNLDENAIEYYSRIQSEAGGMLNLLTEISSDLTRISTKKSDWLSFYSQNLGMDMLNNALVNTDSLRVMMELILENSYRKLSVTELNRNFPLILPVLSEIMSKYSHMKFKKSILVVSKDFEMDKEVLEKHNIQLQLVTETNGLNMEKTQDIVISSFTSGSVSDLQNLISMLVGAIKPSGFILLFYKESISPAEKFLSLLCGSDLQIQSQATLKNALKNENLVMLSKISDPFGGGLYLLRSSAPEEADKVIQITEGAYSWVEELRTELYSEKTERLWLVSQDSPTSGIVGMVNCLKQEPKGEKIRCIFISHDDGEYKLPAFSFEEPLYKPLLQRNLLMNVWRDGSWGSYRHILIREHMKLKECKISYVTCRKTGDLSSFEWAESPMKYTELRDLVPIEIYYSALNFKDVMLASGKLTLKDETEINEGVNDNKLGFEFSGRDASGRRICGMAKNGGIATATLANYIIEVPDHWSLEEAVTIPVVYSTCYYALIMRGKLKSRESILIHSGTGGIGLAAIRIALSLDCEIFTTVGNDEKRQYLKKLFPQLKEENIGCSRNVTFEKMVMTRTNGLGVNVVLNSLADDKLLASLRCLARYGRFIEIGKYDLMLDTKIGLKMFLEDRQFHGVCLDKYLNYRSGLGVIKDDILDLIRDGIKKGVVQPLDRTIFDKNKVEDAFRYMTKGVHVGKVILKIRDEEANKVVIPKSLYQPAVPRTYFYNEKVYIVVGGLGGFGVEVTKWIVDRGGRHIILTSRYGARTPYHHLCLKRWKYSGIDVRVSTLNVARRDEALQLLKEATHIGPVGGIFNSAVILKDAFMDCQTPDDFQDVCGPKATATKFLDEFSRKLCPDLDYFVCFSSISCGRGNAGQTNYGFANSVMERVCEERRRVGLHGLSIQWGIIGEVGVVHRHMGDDAMISGVIAQSVHSCLRAMDAFLQQDSPVVSSYMTAVERKKTGQGDVLAQLAKVLGTSDISEINPTRSFGTMGIDSMVGVELKQLIESSCDVTLSMQEIQNMKIGDVKDMLEKIESEKLANPQGQTLLMTTTLKLPSQLLHADPVIVLNKDGLGIPVFILDIGDTDTEDFRTLADILDRPIFGLVWSKNVPATDIQSVAEWFYKVLQSTFYGFFHLLACSISGNIAIEMALQSQKIHKKLRSLTLLNASEDLVNSLTKEDAESNTDIETLCEFVEQFGSGDAPRLKEELKKVPKLEQQIKIVIQFIKTSSSKSLNENEVSTAISDFIRKRSLVRSYVPSEKLSMDIHLVEDPTKILSNDVTLIKESFAQVFTGKINVHRVCSNKGISKKEDAQRVANIISAYI